MGRLRENSGFIPALLRQSLSQLTITVPTWTLRPSDTRWLTLTPFKRLNPQPPLRSKSIVRIKYFSYCQDPSMFNQEAVEQPTGRYVPGAPNWPAEICRSSIRLDAEYKELKAALGRLEHPGVRMALSIISCGISFSARVRQTRIALFIPMPKCTLVKSTTSGREIRRRLTRNPLPRE